MTIKDHASTYLNLLERWTRSARKELYDCPDRPELSCYGSGENGWGVQTNQKAFAAFAVLAVDPQYHPDEAGIPKEQMKDIALRLLRYSLQSHIEGDYHCSDGQSWGHTWISALGVERMMHGVDALASELTASDQALLRKVLISECDWLLDEYEVVGGLLAKEGSNKPESNLWNGALLHRIADRYPDAARAEQYREKGFIFLINSVSVPSDATNQTVKDGKTVAERFVGANFFETMALNHHDYLNVGYMVICLSNMAMLHFTYKQRGAKAPEALYHYMEELWELVKLCTFSDGRLLRIGGDTRVRYTYCQDYVIPVWHMVKDILGDPDCDRFEEGWLNQIRVEMDANEDDTFLSKRCHQLRQLSPLYYTRLESDRAVALSMGLVWRPLIGLGEEEAKRNKLAPSSSIVKQESSGQSWYDEYHGAYLHRSDKRIASWVWESAEKPQGLCLPTEASDMAEWKENLSVRLDGIGRITEQKLEQHNGQRFDGGFITWGSTLHYTQGILAEGQPDHHMARSRIVCAALPDNTNMIVLQFAEALERRTYLNQVKGLHLLMPNDLFNGNSRKYYYENGVQALQGSGGHDEVVQTGSKWLNIDDQLGVIAAYGAEQLSINRPGHRQIGLKGKLINAGNEGMLYADEICGPLVLQQQSVHALQVIADAGFVLQAGVRHEDTMAYGHGGVASLEHHSGCVRGVRMRGADGQNYALVANFGNIAEMVSLVGLQGHDVATGEKLEIGEAGKMELRLEPGAARLIRTM